MKDLCLKGGYWVGDSTKDSNHYGIHSSDCIMLDVFLQTTAKLATRSFNFLHLRVRCMFSFGFSTPVTELSHLTRQICLLFSFSKAVHSSWSSPFIQLFCDSITCFRRGSSLALLNSSHWAQLYLLHSIFLLSSFQFAVKFYNIGGDDEKCSISSSFQCISFFFSFLRAWDTYDLMNVKIKRCNYVLRNWSHGILKNWVNSNSVSGTHWNSNIWWKVQRF